MNEDSSAPGPSGHYAALDDAASQTSPGVVHSALASWLEEIDAQQPILDLGTGRGDNLHLLGPRTFGADVSLAALRDARRHRPVVAAEGARLPFPDGSFGTVVCTEVLEHVGSPERVIAEMARVLRPSGLAYITTPNYANLAGLHKWVADRRSGRHDWNPWGAHEGGFEAFMTAGRLTRAARPHLRVLRIRGFDYGQALTGRFQALDRIAWSTWGKRVLRRVLPALEGSSGPLGRLGMHTELVGKKLG